jgi:hypothetical protein
MKKRRVREIELYSNYFDDEKEKWVRDDMIERRLEDNNKVPPTDDEVYQEWANFYDSMLWDDFRDEIKHHLKDTWLVVSGSCGLWNGRAAGGNVVKGWEGVEQVMYDMDYVTVTDTGGMLCISCSHHDGSNYWEVRELTDKGLSWYDGHEDELDRRELVEGLFYGKGLSRNINYARNVFGSTKAGKLVER